MSKEKKLETMLTISTGLLVLYLIFSNVLFLYGAVAAGITGLFVGFLSGLITKGWFKLSELLGLVTSKILLTIVFYVFLYPTAWISKRFNNDKLQLKNRKDSLFYERNHLFSPGDFESPW